MKHNVSEIVENDNAKIFTDMHIPVELKLAHDKPDICIIDKKKKQITILDVGITSKENLHVREREKVSKYELLADELSSIYKYKAKIVPIVMTWDCLTTTKFKHFAKICLH